MPVQVGLPEGGREGTAGRDTFPCCPPSSKPAAGCLLPWAPASQLCPDRAHHVWAGGVFPVRLVRDKPVKYCCPYILMPTSLQAWAPGPLALLRGSPTASQFPAPPQGRLPLQPPLVHGGERVTHTHTPVFYSLTSPLSGATSERPQSGFSHLVFISGERGVS